MKLGVLKDIKKDEYRVILTPGEVSMYIHEGHKVFVEKGAGEAAGFSDDEYREVGALLTDKNTIFDKCELIAKVKEIE